jgi:capsule polysaccharide export protein KpsE/RkpR
MTLFEFWKPKKSPAPQVDTLVYLKKLTDMINFQKGASGLVQIEVTAPTPRMAAGISNQLASEIDKFAREKTLQTLQIQITYLTEQVAITEERRKSANSKMLVFLNRNRNIDPELSPSLFAEYTELKMQVDVTNQRYLLMKEELESAQISLYKKEPLLMFIDPAAEPFFRFAPRGKILLSIHFALGIALAGFLHFVIFLRGRSRKGA